MEIIIQDKKLELIHWITESIDDKKIDEMYNQIQFDSEGWHYSVTDEEKISIEKGIEEAEIGNLIPHSEVMEMINEYV
jgi:hypothetical protein